MALPIEALFRREDFHRVCFLVTDAELRALYERECGGAKELPDLLCAAVAEMEMARRGLVQLPLNN